MHHDFHRCVLLQFTGNLAGAELLCGWPYNQAYRSMSGYFESIVRFQNWLEIRFVECRNRYFG